MVTFRLSQRDSWKSSITILSLLGCCLGIRSETLSVFLSLREKIATLSLGKVGLHGECSEREYIENKDSTVIARMIYTMCLRSTTCHFPSPTHTLRSTRCNQVVASQLIIPLIPNRTCPPRLQNPRLILRRGPRIILFPPYKIPHGRDNKKRTENHRRIIHIVRHHRYRRRHTEQRQREGRPTYRHDIAKPSQPTQIKVACLDLLPAGDHVDKNRAGVAHSEANDADAGEGVEGG